MTRNNDFEDFPKMYNGNSTPSEGVAETREMPTPSEGVKGDGKGKTTSRSLWRYCGDSTPSKGVAETRGKPTPSEGVRRDGISSNEKPPTETPKPDGQALLERSEKSESRESREIGKFGKFGKFGKALRDQYPKAASFRLSSRQWGLTLT